MLRFSILILGFLFLISCTEKNSDDTKSKTKAKTATKNELQFKIPKECFEHFQKLLAKESQLSKHAKIFAEPYKSWLLTNNANIQMTKELMSLAGEKGEYMIFDFEVIDIGKIEQQENRAKAKSWLKSQRFGKREMTLHSAKENGFWKMLMYLGPDYPSPEEEQMQVKETKMLSKENAMLEKLLKDIKANKITDKKQMLVKYNHIKNQDPNSIYYKSKLYGCLNNLRELGKAVQKFQEDYGRGVRVPAAHKVKFITTLYKKGLVVKHDLFICPATSDKTSRDALRNDHENCTSYEARSVPVITLRNATTTPLIWDKKDNHPGKRNVLFLDGRCEDLTEEDFQKLMKAKHQSSKPDNNENQKSTQDSKELEDQNDNREEDEKQEQINESEKQPERPKYLNENEVKELVKTARKQILAGNIQEGLEFLDKIIQNPKISPDTVKKVKKSGNTFIKNFIVKQISTKNFDDTIAKLTNCLKSTNKWAKTSLENGVLTVIHHNVLNATKQNQYSQAEQILNNYKGKINSSSVEKQLEKFFNDVIEEKEIWETLRKGVLYRRKKRKVYKIKSSTGTLRGQIVKLTGKGHIMVKERRGFKTLHLSQLTASSLNDFIVDGLRPNRISKKTSHKFGLFLFSQGKLKQAERKFVRAGSQEYFQNKLRFYIERKKEE